ncbi:MAG: glycosyltransferase [Pseudomonadota bacterium]
MIAEAYTLFSRIPIYRDAQGRYATDPMWQWDLERHFDYIAQLRLCCPVIQVEVLAPELAELSTLSDRNVLALRAGPGWLAVLRNLIPNGLGVYRALKTTEIAHSDGAGWPFPLSYYIWLLRPLVRVKWVVIVESAFFRMPKFGKPTLRQMLSHHLNSWLVRRCVRSADARVFSTETFRELFLGHKAAALIAPVVWVKEKDRRSSEAHAARAPTGPRRVRLIFPSRLVPDKGVQSLLDAIRLCAERGATAPEIHIMGAGDLAETCRQTAKAHPEILTQVLEPMPYGADFFAFLHAYDGLIVASLQETGQPRILYDALSQGLPCLASDTIATRETVTEGQTGLLFKPGDAASLADRLIEIAEAPERMHEMGREALTFAGRHTHESMHQVRERFLIETLHLAEGAGPNKTEE